MHVTIAQAYFAHIAAIQQHPQMMDWNKVAIKGIQHYTQHMAAACIINHTTPTTETIPNNQYSGGKQKEQAHKRKLHSTF